jgi:hypothetical protein
MSWLFSQALVEEYSAGTSLAGEPSAQLNVMPTPHKFWRNDRTMESSDLSQFGLTLKLLTAGPGEELLMSYLAAFRVRTSVALERVPESKASEADYGLKCGASFARYDRNTSSWRTPQSSLLEGLDVFSETWPRWGSMRNGASYLRQTSVPIISAKGSGFVPTPTATDYKSESMSLELVQKRQMSSKRGVRLTEFLQRKMVPTPMAGNTHWGGRLDELGGSSNPFRGTEVGKLKLNPRWTEQLMGWITDWTDLKPLEMDKFQSWLQQHSLNLPADLNNAA